MPEPFICSKDSEIKSELVNEYIEKHAALLPRYIKLMEYYKGQHPILTQDDKEEYKPDNRLVVNYAKYIVDTLNGYLIGKPIRVSHAEPELSETINALLKRNDQDDNNAELSKMCSIYGHAYELLYQNEDSETCITYNDPLTMFVVYDDTVAQKPLFAVRYYEDTEGQRQGNVYTLDAIYEISSADGFSLVNPIPNLYGDIPVIEWIENEERMSVFEPVETLIDGYNKALSEKANDVDYFADAYLKIIGALIEEGKLGEIRDHRIINLAGINPDAASQIVVEFMDKPNADQTQENLIERLEKLIFQMSMVSNINDESFGNASGISLLFKLQSMENLALMKERKISSAMNRRFKMIFNVVTNVPATQKDEWRNLEYTFVRNIPKDVQSEAETASKLQGQVSKETQLKALSSLVPDPQQEIERMEQEAEQEAERNEQFDYPTTSFGGVADGQDEQELLGKATDSAMETSR